MRILANKIKGLSDSQTWLQSHLLTNNREEPKKTTLNRQLLKKLKTKAERYVIYADVCLMDAAELKKMNIVFKKIPRDITRL